MPSPALLDSQARLPAAVTEGAPNDARAEAVAASSTLRLAMALLLFALSTSGAPGTSGASGASAATAMTPSRGGVLPHPVLFVTQVPIPADFATIGSVFANHGASMQQAARGGDLYVRYPDGTLRNLTAEAGYGSTGVQQGADAIAVRGPSVHFSGTKALFSMVVGAPTQQYQVIEKFWQLYEVTGLAQGEQAVISVVPHQPQNANNVSPIYLSDGRIAFVSDRPRNGAAHLYPQLDEYESTPTPTGIWALDPISGELALLDHAPSGGFTPILDSFGRIVFTRWDHLQQDQQADADALNGSPIYGAFEWADESATAAQLPLVPELFPEPRPARTDLLAGTPWEGHRLNNFFPWEMAQDGSAMEMINHVGRHELHGYFNRSRHDDPNLQEFIQAADRPGFNTVENLLQMREHPMTAGRYVATDAPEFQTHAAGRIVQFDAAPGANPDGFAVSYLTHPSTNQVVADGATPPPEHTGHYRDPVILSDGTLLVAHTAETRAAGNDGPYTAPVPRYDFKLKPLVAAGNGYQTAGASLTGGITKTVSYWDPDTLITYSGDLWELDPVEVRARSVPPNQSTGLAPPEQAVFDGAGVEEQELRQWLRQRDLALLVARDVTTRDAADLQQPYNLAVAGGVSTIGSPGTVYTVRDFQIFQGDQVRGYSNFRDGRRVLARTLHDAAAAAANVPHPSGVPGSVPIASDGSVAAFVPARRALSWQTVDPGGEPVVRERFWVTFQPGEIRACDGCHGVNTSNQAGQNGAADNQPLALAQLLQHWVSDTQVIFADGFESSDTSAWTSPP